MNEDLIRQAIVEAVTDEIALRVSQKLLEKQKKVLVVCTGSLLGFSEWLVGLQQLQQAGFSFDLFLSQGATRVLDVGTLTRAVPFGTVYRGDVDMAPEALAGQYFTILVPALTIATASRLASCTADTPASRMIFNSMMRGKNVIVATDGCCPDNPARTALGYRLTEPLRQKLRANLEAVQAYGAQLTSAEKIASKVQRVISGTAAFGGKSCSEKAPKPACIAPPAGSTTVRKHIIGRGDLVGLAPGAVLRVAPESQVTQMARDIARTKGIQIVRERN